MKILVGYPLNKFREFDNILDLLSKKYELIFKDYNYEWLKHNLDDIDILIPSLKVIVDDAVISNSKKLKLIFTPTTGIDHIMITKDIKVLSLNDYKEDIVSISSTAELAFALLLGISRKIFLANKDVLEAKKWERNKFIGINLDGKTIGIIGMGRIGQKIAQYSKTFGMDVVYYDKNRHEEWKKLDITQLLSLSDFVIVAISFTKETYHLINMDNIKFLKKGAILINISRGKIIEEEALCNALENGTLSGVGVDVLEFELEKFDDSPLFKFANKNPYYNIIITPHIGGATIEAWKKVFSLIFNKILGENII